MLSIDFFLTMFFSPVFRTFFPLSLYIQYTCLIGTMHSCLWPFGRSQPFLLSEPTPPWEADALALFQRDIQRSSWAREGYRHIPYICFHCFHPSPCIWEGAKRWAFPSALVPPSHSCCMSQRPPKGQTTRLCMLLYKASLRLKITKYPIKRGSFSDQHEW